MKRWHKLIIIFLVGFTLLGILLFLLSGEPVMLILPLFPIIILLILWWLSTGDYMAWESLITSLPKTWQYVALGGGFLFIVSILILHRQEERKSAQWKENARHRRTKRTRRWSKLYEGLENVARERAQLFEGFDICPYATNDPEYKSRIKKRYRQESLICKADRKPCEGWHKSSFDWRDCTRLPGRRGERIEEKEYKVTKLDGFSRLF